jgi:hypothetical protein
VLHGRTQAVGDSERLTQLMAGSDVIPWAAGERDVSVCVVTFRV